MTIFYTGELTPENPKNKNRFNHKGTVASISNLPSLTDAEIGDSYNVADSGKNYACELNSNGEKYWDDLGGIQVQPDWNQADNTQVDYIKNKPTIPTIPTNISSFTNDVGYLTQHQDISGKQDVLTAGNNITIQNNVISATGGGTDPNEIADGTIYTGKFSDLPTFFSGLSGKYCKGTITYKISEDETLDTSTLVIDIPLFFINNLVIDGDEKTITIPLKSAWQNSVVLKDTTNSNISGFILQNINITTNDTHTLSFIIKTNNMPTIVKSCSFSGKNKAGDGVQVFSRQATILNNEFVNTNGGLISASGSNVYSSNNLFSNLNYAHVCYMGGIIMEADNTLSSVSNPRTTMNQSFQTGIFYKS